MVDSYMSPSRRRTAIRSTGAPGKVSRNQPFKNRTCWSRSPYRAKLFFTHSRAMPR